MTDSSLHAAAWTRSPADWIRDRDVDERPPVRSSCYVTVRDGTRLAVDVWLPAAGGVVPTIVALTPYYRRFALGARAVADPCPGLGPYRDLFPRHGYAFVAVDVRGTGASFGSRAGMRAPLERLDAYDVVDWTVRQAWSDGAVGLTGISYVGAGADFAASTGHPAIRAVMPISSVWDTWGDMFYPGGLLFTGMLGGYGRMMEALDRDQRAVLAEYPYFSNPAFAGPAPVDEDPDGTLLQAALRAHDANFDMTDFITQLGFRGDALRHDPSFTTDTIAPRSYAAGIPADVAHYGVSGWMDGAGYTAGCIARFAALPNAAKRMLLGPWDHGARTHVSPARTVGPAPAFEMAAEMLRFFDAHVAGRDSGLGHEAPVHYYTMIEEAWHAANRFPPAGTAMQTLALGADGTMGWGEAGGAAGMVRHVASQSLGTGRHTRYERIAGQAVTAYYDDWHGRDAAMLCWTSAASIAEIEITGTPVVRLFFSADTRDAAVIVYLEDVGPDGHTRYVTEGALRASCRALNASTGLPLFTRAAQAHLLPGEVVELEIAMHPTSWLLRAGHRLRLALAGADRDHLVRVPFGQDPAFTVHWGPSMPSCLRIPVVPR